MAAQQGPGFDEDLPPVEDELNIPQDGENRAGRNQLGLTQEQGPYIDPTTDPSFGPLPGGGNALGLPRTPQGDDVPQAGLNFQGATADQAALDEANLSGVGLGPTAAGTREVQAVELVANQLSGLLSGDSKFIMNARRRAAEMANRRGQFGSSMFAGAAERAATEAALPIATADAQAYRDAATQNLAAQNQNAIANIQRAAQLDTALLSSRTNIALGNLDASTRVGIANMNALTQIDISNLDAATRTNISKMQNTTNLLLQDMQSKLQLEMQGRSFVHDRSIAKFNQEGRMQLAELDANLRTELQARGFTHDIDMSELNHEQQTELNTILQEYDLEKQGRDHAFNRRQSHINMSMQAQVNYINYLSSFAGTEMDAAAASRLQQQADAQLVATFQMINGLYPDQPAIEVQFGTIGG